jgi:beta-glucuronidase
MLNMVKAQEQIMVNAFNRQATSLNGYWKYIVDPYENGFYNYRYEPFENLENPGNGAYFTNAKRKSKSDLVEYDFDKMDSLQVPGDWNSQKENLFYYEGTIWYKKSFTYTKSNSQNRVFLYFGASNYETDVYLNGKKLGKHVGGFTPFQFELTSLLKEQNVVIVKVDNKRKKEGVPTLNTDWWNYGGITRDVKLIETSSTYIADYHIYLSDENNQLIKGIIELNGDDKKNSEITLAIPELGIKKEFKTDQNGKSEFEFNLKNITYWSPSSPKLYDITLSTKSDKITDQIGFRSIKTQGADILLNGESIFLKGISIHEESPINGGRCNSEEDALKLLKYAQSLGCNFVRLAHYPHNEHMLRLADQMGILVWEENPVYWTISWENEETYSNAQHQLSEVIDRDKNRASVIIWSMANETPISDARNKFLTKLAKYTKVKDPTRLISAALELHSYEDIPNSRTIQDPFVDMVDILSFNQYIGWYDGTVEKCKEIKWIIKENKPVFVSEFGAGAKYGLHGEKDDIWTEEYQEYLYEETLKMLAQIEQLRGMSPWILVDFKSPRRVLPEVQDNYNRKGLISDHGEKKKAFYVLKNYYESKN